MEWLLRNNLSECIEVFEKNKIKGSSLLKLQDSHLQGMGIDALGLRIQIKDAICKLKEISNGETRAKMKRQLNRNKKWNEDSHVLNKNFKKNDLEFKEPQSLFKKTSPSQKNKIEEEISGEELSMDASGENDSNDDDPGGKPRKSSGKKKSDESNGETEKNKKKAIKEGNGNQEQKETSEYLKGSSSEEVKEAPETSKAGLKKKEEEASEEVKEKETKRSIPPSLQHSKESGVNETGMASTEKQEKSEKNLKAEKSEKKKIMGSSQANNPNNSAISIPEASFSSSSSSETFSSSSSSTSSSSQSSEGSEPTLKNCQMYVEPSSGGGTFKKKALKHHPPRRYQSERQASSELKDISRFQIDNKMVQFDKLLGEGGYGKVYLGTYLGQTVAIKEYGLKRKESIKLNFLREVKVLSELRHPNILLYMGVITNHREKYYMVTEYMERGSLYDHLHGKYKTRFSEEKMFDMIEDIVIGMRYMIDKNYFHCDLKSNNILIDENWTVKLCDFGLAINRRKSRKKGKITGTPNWMAPEILRGQRFEEASDVYSFGLVVWYSFHLHKA